MLVIYRGMELLRRVERWAAPFVLVMTAALVWWAIDRAHGLGPILHSSSGLGWDRWWGVFVPSLTAMIGFWSTLSLNMPDFTRYGRSQREQMIGQVVALPTTMTVFAAMGVVITSATTIIYGAQIWDPIALVSRFHSPIVVAIAMFTIVIATLAVNIAANVVSPANDFAHAFPRKIDFKTGGLITGLLGIAFQPWELLANSKRYIDGWLIGYSGALGAIGGVLIVDYWVLRKTRLAIADLYDPAGAYHYRRGWNPAAVIATVVGAGVALGGAFWSPMKPIYDYAWFIGFGLAGGLYYALSAPRLSAGRATRG